MKSLESPVGLNPRTGYWKFNPIGSIVSIVNEARSEFDCPATYLRISNATVLEVLFENERIQMVDKIGAIHVFQSMQYQA